MENNYYEPRHAMIQRKAAKLLVTRRPQDAIAYCEGAIKSNLERVKGIKYYDPDTVKSVDDSCMEWMAIIAHIQDLIKTGKIHDNPTAP